MNACPLCGTPVDDRRIIRHYADDCPKSARRFRYFETANTKVATPLLTRVWEQIEDILVESEFVR